MTNAMEGVLRSLSSWPWMRRLEVIDEAPVPFWPWRDSRAVLRANRSRTPVGRTTDRRVGGKRYHAVITGPARRHPWCPPISGRCRPVIEKGPVGASEWSSSNRTAKSSSTPSHPAHLSIIAMRSDRWSAPPVKPESSSAQPQNSLLLLQDHPTTTSHHCGCCADGRVTQVSHPSASLAGVDGGDG